MKISCKSIDMIESIQELKRKSISNGKFQHLKVENYHWIMTPDGVHGEVFFGNCLPL